VFIKDYILTAMFAVCIHGLGTTVNISSSMCKHPQFGRIYTDIQRLSEFAFLSRNKSDKKDKVSNQSLNITSSSNAIVKILCHTITLFVTPVRINTGSR